MSAAGYKLVTCHGVEMPARQASQMPSKRARVRPHRGMKRRLVTKASNTARMPGRSLVICKPGTGVNKTPSYECGQIKPLATKHVDGRYKVCLPHGKMKVRS